MCVCVCVCLVSSHFFTSLQSLSISVQIFLSFYPSLLCFLSLLLFIFIDFPFVRSHLFSHNLFLLYFFNLHLSFYTCLILFLLQADCEKVNDLFPFLHWNPSIFIFISFLHPFHLILFFSEIRKERQSQKESQKEIKKEKQ